VLYGRIYIYREPKKDKLSADSGHVYEAENRDTITLHYHERRPYYITEPDGIHGLCADPANQIFQKAEIPYCWQKTPAKRQLEIIKQNKRMACAVGWFRNKEREKFAKFTLSIYQDKPTLALARADNSRIESGFPIEKTMTDRKLCLLQKDSYSYGKFIDEKIRQFKPVAVKTTGDNLGMLKMIYAHRGDYFFLADEEALGLILQSGFSKKAFKLVRFSDIPAGNKRHILCSMAVDDSIIDRLNRAIQECTAN